MKIPNKTIEQVIANLLINDRGVEGVKDISIWPSKNAGICVINFTCTVNDTGMSYTLAYVYVFNGGIWVEDFTIIQSPSVNMEEYEHRISVSYDEEHAQIDLWRSKLTDVCIGPSLNYKLDNASWIMY